MWNVRGHRPLPQPARPSSPQCVFRTPSVRDTLEAMMNGGLAALPVALSSA
jgi:hypothetical protein